jgi:purine-nucleoside phosphorylase
MNTSRHEPAIVAPVKIAHTPDLGPVSIMVAPESDLKKLCRSLDIADDVWRKFFTGKLYQSTYDGHHFSLAGPFIGAPCAAMMLETLITWGAERIIFLGWCGAISKDVKIGDIVVPTAATIDEGTSGHYQSGESRIAHPSAHVLEKIRKILSDEQLEYHEGLIWTTDAAFRETRPKVVSHQSKGVLAVEMEMSALFTVGDFHQVMVGGILVVSDELSSLTWRPGFKSERFENGRKRAVRVVSRLCKSLIDL